MSKWTEDLAIAILQANVHGRKKKVVSILEMADACKFLVNKYKNQEKVSKLVKVMGREMVREFYNISTLPNDVKKLIDQGKIRIDVAQRIFKINNKSRQIKTAKIVSGLPAHDARKIIDYVINHPNEVNNAKKIVQESKNTIKKYETLVVPLNMEQYSILNQYAKKYNLSATRYVKNLVEEKINDITKLKKESSK